jgi:alanyl-tRNA synthetase
MFFDTGIPGSAESRPGVNDGKYMEIWNDVFMQYNKQADGSYVPLSQKNVDTGMGIERTVAVLQGKKSVYDTEVFQPILQALGEIFSRSYGSDEEGDRSMRIIADHVKAATFILGDENGVSPSNVQQGYILRRLIRRAVRHGRKLLGREGMFLHQPAQKVIDMYRHAYPELGQNADRVLDELVGEEKRFLDTLQKGEHEFEKMLPKLLEEPSGIIPGHVAFRLYDTFGFPIEITEELASEHNLQVDRGGFDEAFREHQERSKMDTKQSFKGGLADQSEQTTRLHTATHLLHQALREVLGDHVAQKGSNITPERLRFDFSHPEKMSKEQIREVERIVNEKIQEDLPVSYDTMTLEKARENGAVALFGDKYDEVVKVYSIGNFSKEVCGGPHVDHTGELGGFKILKEQSSSQGVRRIKAVVGDEASDGNANN